MNFSKEEGKRGTSIQALRFSTATRYSFQTPFTNDEAGLLIMLDGASLCQDPESVDTALDSVRIAPQLVGDKADQELCAPPGLAALT